MKTAIVIGATGLVGSQLVSLLLNDSRFDRVIVFVRRSTGIVSPKLEEVVINFDEENSWRHLVKGDVLFSTLGTTLKQAGGKEPQFKVDFTYQLRFADAAAANGVARYVLVSSSGANEHSVIFYSKMKGQLEEKIKKLPFTSISILQPGLLAGRRQQERVGEKIGYLVLRGFNTIGLFKSYRPIDGKIVAQAMINAAVRGLVGVHVYKLEEVFKLADEMIK